MAGNVSGIHVFAADVGPESLSLLDGVNNAFIASLNNLSTFSNSYVDSGAVNALVVSVPSPQTFGYIDGVMVQVKVAVTNTTTAPTINVNGLGAKTIVNADGSAVAIGQLKGGGWVTLQYEAITGVFMVVGGGSLTSASTASVLASNNTWTGSNTFSTATTFSSNLTLSGSLLNALFATNVGAGQAWNAGPGTTGSGGAVSAYFYNDAPHYVNMVLTSSTSTSTPLVGGPVGEQFLIGPSASIPFTLTTGNVARLGISGAGNVKVYAPTSGVALSVYGIPGQQQLAIYSGNAGVATGDLYITRAGSTANSLAQGPNFQFVDSVSTYQSLMQQSGGQTEIWQYNGSAWNQMARWTLTGSFASYGPNAAQVIDLTPDQGTWVGTLSGGFTSNPSGIFKWRRVGSGTVNIYVDAAITGTSNATTDISVSGVPAAITPSSNRFAICWGLENAGGVNYMGIVTITTSSTLTLQLVPVNSSLVNGNAANLWTSSGLKGIGSAGFSFFYSL